MQNNYQSLYLIAQINSYWTINIHQQNFGSLSTR